MSDIDTETNTELDPEFEVPFNPVQKREKNPMAGLKGALAAQQLTRGMIMRKLNDRLPTNELGLPLYIYRTDMISVELFSPQTTEQERMEVQSAASVTLDYFEGYPVQPNGDAFWSKLEFEPGPDYKIFSDYLGIVTHEEDSGRLIAPVRTFEAISQYTGLPQKELIEKSNLYYWGYRAKAFDMFNVTCHQKQRETRVIQTEDSHFRTARKWLAKANERMEQIFNDDMLLDEMRPKEILDMMERMMKMQRVAVGLPANGSVGNNDGGPKNASLEIALRTVAKNAGEEARSDDSDVNRIDQLMQDPGSLTQLQELIIKAQR